MKNKDKFLTTRRTYALLEKSYPVIHEIMSELDGYKKVLTQSKVLTKKAEAVYDRMMEAIKGKTQYNVCLHNVNYYESTDRLYLKLTFCVGEDTSGRNSFEFSLGKQTEDDFLFDMKLDELLTTCKAVRKVSIQQANHAYREYQALRERMDVIKQEIPLSLRDSIF